MRTDKITIPRWFDRHLHLRHEDMLETVLPHTLRSQAFGAVVMGNLPHPLMTSTVDRTINYRAAIDALLPAGCGFAPVMTCYLTDDITPDEVIRGFEEGVWRAVKLYLAGPNGTTNSGHGVRDLSGRRPIFAAMEKAGVPLLGHFESQDPAVSEFDREMISIYTDLAKIVQSFPDLPIVVEHLTDERSAEFIMKAGPNVYATVTPHHLMINENAMFDGGMNPVHYCRPVPKSEKSRRRLRELIASGNSRFGAGTDSAPHSAVSKAKIRACAAGIFNAPAAPALYATVFDEENAMEHLGSFMSGHFLGIYDVEPSKETMTLKRQPCSVPELVGGEGLSIPVFKGGEIIPWTLIEA